MLYLGIMLLAALSCVLGLAVLFALSYAVARTDMRYDRKRSPSRLHPSGAEKEFPPHA